MEEKVYCFDCLQHQIHSDFSDKLTLNYGISSSGLPFGSSAVVQVSETAGESSAAQFILEYISENDQNYLTHYINEFISNSDNGCNNRLVGGNPFSGINGNYAGGGDETQQDEAAPSDLVIDKSSKKCTFRFSGRLSCSRAVTGLAPIAYVGNTSYSNFEEVANNFLSSSLENHVLESLCSLIEGKASGRDGINFLSLIGVPCFEQDSLPGSLRHPNLAPVLSIMRSYTHVNILLPRAPYTLENVLHFSPDALKSDWHVKFLIYQLLSVITYVHGLGIAHGNICPSNVMLTKSLWCWLKFSYNRDIESNITPRKSEGMDPTSTSNSCCKENCHLNSVYADLKLLSPIDWPSSFMSWWRGELSNFEYLIILNRLAGRRWGDHSFHPVMPWVIDFSITPDDDSDLGWRDLRKSKWRLAKGDEQLDFTYLTSEIPHHVSDECLSELAVCSYKARRLPLSVLRRAVRSVYEPNEYPSTMQRLYQWTPDECIPEFYSDPQIFISLHDGMADLAVPLWAQSPDEFIKLHRGALESHRVSNQLHHWIDITFGYKMSGQAAVAAKNVMLPISESTMPRSIGRRQLFTQPHPVRKGSARNLGCLNKYSMIRRQVNELESETAVLSETAYLQELEEASVFCEHARHLSACYGYPCEKFTRDTAFVVEESIEVSEKRTSKPSQVRGNCGLPLDVNFLVNVIEEEDQDLMGYQELFLWRKRVPFSQICSKDIAKDIFSIGCLIAELHLRRPIFDSISLEAYLENGTLPETIQDLSPPTRVFVKACIEKDWMRPSAKALLDSPFFPQTVKSSYLFLSPLQLLAHNEYRLQYAANFAKQGALQAMGTYAAEMCAPYCLQLLTNSLNDFEAECAYILLKEFIKCLATKAVNTLILPTIQKILQITGYSRLKVSLLQDSFVRELWHRVGKLAYLEAIHPLVISNLYVSPEKSSASSASVLLIGSSEELGVPITIHQTILPLVHCFGKGLSADGIDVLIRIGGLFGEWFIVRHMLPILKLSVRSFMDISGLNQSEPVQSWSSLALIDCLTTLNGLMAFLSEDTIIVELLKGGSCLHVNILMQDNLEIRVLQASATSLLAICQRIGPDLTGLHVLPQLREIFDELAFSQQIATGSVMLGRSLKTSIPGVTGEPNVENRTDLVLLLYPSFASFLGIERLRRNCATWLLLEKFLLRYHNWKWESTGESCKSGSENTVTQRLVLGKSLSSDYNPSKLLFNGVGWSTPQSQETRSAKKPVHPKQSHKVHQDQADGQEGMSDQANKESWFWFPSPATSWDGPDFLGRNGVLKDDLPWKIRASIIYSLRAHHGAVRSLAVCQDECTVFTAGIGQGFKGIVQKWELSQTKCLSGYYGHDEIVNDVCILSSSERVASCDGTIHIWDSRTGKQISVFTESQVESARFVTSQSSSSKTNTDNTNVLNLNAISHGILTGAFDGNLYTCMHQMEFSDTLVIGMGNASLRFIDAAQGKKLHVWRGESVESGFPSLVSAICSCGSAKVQGGGVAGAPSFIAAGLSSGYCKLFDAKSGKVVASWRAHDGYVTKLATPEDHLLVSSSLDKTLRVWDLRRNLPSQPVIFKGHTDIISGFSFWGQDIISISRNKIGLISLSKTAEEDRFVPIIPQKLYMADQGNKNPSALSSISILPFSRLFLVGTEDGYLRICC